MKVFKMPLKILSLLLIAVLALSCSKDKENKPVKDSITVAPASASLFESGFSVKEKGASKTVSFNASSKWTVNISSASAMSKAVDWITVNPVSGDAGNVSITITISDNKNTAPRSAIITIICGNASKTIRINQDGFVVNVEGISLSKTALELTKGQSETLEVEFRPSDATEKNVTWSSSNGNVAAVQNGKVTAVGGGYATITANCSGKTATCNVKVTVDATEIKLNQEYLTLLVGEEQTLVATVSPSDATDKTVTWESSNPTVATVDSYGKVKAAKEGEAVISAKVSELSATCTVTVNKPYIQVTSVTLDKEKLELLIGDDYTLKATILPAEATDKTLVWTSSDPSVATVDNNGKVKALSIGGTYIRVDASDYFALCDVLVKSPIIDVSSVSIQPQTLSLAVGEAQYLQATILPDNATDKTVTWTSSNPSVVSVDRYGYVSARAPGSAIITATSNNGKQANCTVTVPPPVIEVISISLNKPTLNLYTGNTEKLTATILPENATDKTVTWTSSNPTVATVDQNGNVTALKAGYTDVKGTSKNGLFAVCKVIIHEYNGNLDLGDRTEDDF